MQHCRNAIAACPVSKQPDSSPPDIMEIPYHALRNIRVAHTAVVGRNVGVAAPAVAAVSPGPGLLDVSVAHTAVAAS